MTTFTIDGMDITPRLGGAGPTATVGPVSAGVLVSYRTVSGDVLGVVVQVTSSVNIDTNGGFGASYVDPAGRQV